MKFVLIFWPQAVGKMTVWHELEKITKLKLFHNHMTIDLVLPFFWYWWDNVIGTNLVMEFRERIFEEYSKSHNEWLIFTFVWDFDCDFDWKYIEKISNIFKNNWWEVFYVELEADIDTRIERNKTEHRLNHKPVKRNLDWSEKELLDSTEKYRLNSRDWELNFENYIRINNTNISPADVAKIIVDRFKIY